MDAAQFQKISKALADPRRFKILEVISAAGNELCCGAVVECFPVAQATISHHLKELIDAGLVEARSEGQFKLLRARPDVLSEYTDHLKSVLAPARGKAGKAASAGTARRRTARV